MAPEDERNILKYRQCATHVNAKHPESTRVQSRNSEEHEHVSGEENVRELEDEVGHLTTAFLLRGVKSRQSPRQHHDDSTTTPPQHNQKNILLPSISIMFRLR